MALLDNFMKNPSTVLGLSVLQDAANPARGLLAGQSLLQRQAQQRSALESDALRRQLMEQQILRNQQQDKLAADRQAAMRGIFQRTPLTGATAQQMASGQIPATTQSMFEQDPQRAITELAAMDPQAAIGFMNALKPGGATNINIDMNEPLKITEMMNIRDREGNPPPLDATRQSVIAATNPDGTPKYTVKSPKQQEKEANVDTALNLVGTLENLAFPKEGEPLFKEYEGPFGRAMQGVENMWDEMGQTEDRGSRLRLYNHARQGFLSMLARTFGERGTLTNQDIGRALKLTAAADYWPDQPDVAKNAFQELNKLIKDIDGREANPNAEATVKAIGDTVFVKMPDGTWETAE
jgi:hypothetical protein